MAEATFVEVEGLYNLRDLGGLPAAGGHVAPRTLYRSDALHLASADGVGALRALRCATIVDLRTSEERDADPGPLDSVHVPLHEAFEDREQPRSLEGREAAEAWLAGLYERLLESAAPRFGEILTLLSDRANLPAILHCAGGKDRTGLSVALVLSAVGVDRDVVLDDYATQPSAPGWQARRAEVHAMIAATGIEPEAVHGLLSAPRIAMRDALAKLDDRYGDVVGYLRDACGVTQAALASLRDNLVVPR